MPANLENSAVATGLENVSFHSNLKERKCQKCSNYSTIEVISHASQVMLKILQARIQQHLNHELPDVQAGFRKGRGTNDQISDILWIIKKTGEFQKSIYFCFLTCIQISQESGQVVWYSHLFKNFPQFVVIHSVKGFSVVNKAEVDIFSGTLLLCQ